MDEEKSKKVKEKIAAKNKEHWQKTNKIKVLENITASVRDSFERVLLCDFY